MNSYKFSITRRSLHESGGWVEHGIFTTVVQARNPTEATSMVQAQYGNTCKIVYIGPA
jgi:hypothetical protein